MTDETRMHLTPVHLTPDRLADLAEDLLSASDTVAAEAHLATCASCQATQAALAAVSLLLASAGQVRMPFEAVRRVEDALVVAADERSEQSAGTGVAAGAAVPVGGTVTALGTAHGRRAAAPRLRRAAAALVGVAAVLGGGFLFTQGFPSMSGSDDAPSSTLAEGSRGDAAAEGGLADAGGNDDSLPAAATGGTEYTAATLVDEVGDLVAAQAHSPAAGLGTTPRVSAPSGNTGESGAGATVGCVAAVAAEAGSTAAPLAVDVGTYNGDPAVVVVLELPRAAADEADIWVVSADCLAADEVTPLEVLQRASLAIVPGLD